MNCKTKLLALTLASVMTASLAGCGASASAGSATSAEATSATQESTPGGEDGVFTIACLRPQRVQHRIRRHPRRSGSGCGTCGPGHPGQTGGIPDQL